MRLVVWGPPSRWEAEFAAPHARVFFENSELGFTCATNSNAPPVTFAVLINEPRSNRKNRNWELVSEPLGDHTKFCISALEGGR